MHAYTSEGARTHARTHAHIRDKYLHPLHLCSYLRSLLKMLCWRGLFLSLKRRLNRKNIDTRLTKAWTAINRLSIIWKSDLTDKMKRSFFRERRIDTAIWMHNMDSNKTAGEEARRQLHKNAASNLEQFLAATPHKTPTVRPPASITKTIQVRRTRHAGHCWRSRDELISDVLLWTPTHGRANAGRPARTYIQQLCEDTGCCPEDLPRAMNDREKWRERVRDIRATSMTWWWWWWWILSWY